MNSPFSNFPHYFPHQEEVIEKATASSKKIVFISGPPGTGKSLIGMSIAYNFEKSLYLCTSKSLQQQLVRDFPDYPILYGRANYPCVMSGDIEQKFPEITCDDCLEGHQESQDEPGRRISCKGRCPYQQSKRMALRANMAILNTSYFLSETNFVGGFSERDMVIVDEVDLLEHAILGFVELNISDSMMKKYRLPYPKFKTKWESWKQWALDILPNLSIYIGNLERDVDGEDIDIDLIRDLRRARALKSKADMLKDLLDENWIYQEIETKRGIRYSFKPTWVTEVAHQYFWDHAERFVVMSGTPPLPRTLGLEPEEWEWIEVPSGFPAQRRPVYYLGVANLTNKTMAQEVEKIIPPVKEILEKYPDSKGLIHTVSYSLCQYVLSHVNSSRLITHGNGVQEKERILAKFKDSRDPLVLVSPVMDRGIDLPYDYCRFVIIVKVPYPDLSDKQTNKRLYGSSYGQVWYRGEAVRSIVQMSMRGMRFTDDECSTWILDSQFGNLYSKSHELFADWWKESLQAGKEDF